MEREVEEDRDKDLMNLTRWVVEQVPRRANDKVNEINLLRRAKDRNIWKSMSAHALNGHAI